MVEARRHRDDVGMNLDGQGRAGGLEHAPSFSQSAYVGFADAIGSAGYDGGFTVEDGGVDVDVAVDGAGDFVAGGHRDDILETEGV